MKENRSFFSSVCALAIPVALQSMLQSSFSIIDQIMIGQLGSVSIAGVGLAGKFSSIYSVVVSAIGAVAGIMLAQYLGQQKPQEVRRSFRVNLWLAFGLALAFTGLCGGFPRQVMAFYSTDEDTVAAAAEYLQLVSATFFPIAGATLLSTLLRCLEKPKLPLYASVISALLNTGLNYILIFGKLGFAAMGAAGAAIATVVSQWANCLIMLLFLPRKDSPLKKQPAEHRIPFNRKQYLAMLLPILACETLWSLGENVYAIIYGHLGTQAAAAMTLINPVVGLVIGALCGISQASAVIVGKLLGCREYDKAYEAGKKLMVYGFLGSVVLAGAVILGRGLYVRIYQVEPAVRMLTEQILLAFALVCPFKVLNMILGSGILRSGGRTKYLMYIDIIGTWCLGVPTGLLAAFRWGLSIPYVYFLLSLEECVRFAIGLWVFHRKYWIRSLESQAKGATELS